MHNAICRSVAPDDPALYIGINPVCFANWLADDERSTACMNNSINSSHLSSFSTELQGCPFTQQRLAAAKTSTMTVAGIVTRVLLVVLLEHILRLLHFASTSLHELSHDEQYSHDREKQFIMRAKVRTWHPGKHGIASFQRWVTSGTVPVTQLRRQWHLRRCLHAWMQLRVKRGSIRSEQTVKVVRAPRRAVNPYSLPHKLSFP